MAGADIRRVLQAYRDELLDEDRAAHVRAALRAGNVYTAGKRRRVEEPNDDDEVVAALLGDALERLELRDIAAVKAQADELVERHGLALDDEAHAELCLGLLRVQADLLRASLRRLREGAVEVESPPPPSSATPPPQPDAQAQGPLLSEMIAQRFDAICKDRGWKAKTAVAKRLSLSLLMQAAGDKPVRAYGPRDGAALNEMLGKLPADYATATRWKGKTPQEIIEASAAEERPRIESATRKRHVNSVAVVFDWLKAAGEFDGENPAASLKIKVTANKRRVWEGEELRRLFSGPWFSGCRSERYTFEPGDFILNDDRFWLPLLGLFHGARLEELAQLRRGDVTERDRVPVLAIRHDEGTQLKNAQSQRLVPIHSELLALGFVEYTRSAAKAESDRIFPRLTPGGKDRKLSHHWSGRFGEYRKAVGIYRRWLDFHSFRHTVATRLSDAGVAAELIADLVGHEQAGTTMTVYRARRAPPALLREALEKLRYPELDKLLAEWKAGRNSGSINATR
jgi:integrase